MSRLLTNAHVAEVARGCVFSETFQTLGDVYANGMTTVTGTASVSKGVATFSGGSLTYSTQVPDTFFSVGGSLSVRFNTTVSASTTYLRVFSYTNSGGSRSISLAHRPSDGSFFAQIRVATGSNCLLFSGTVSTGTWHTFVLTWNLTTLVGLLDGVAFGSDATLGNPSVTESSTTSIVIGGTVSNYTGQVADCRLFVHPTVLTVGEALDYHTNSTFAELNRPLLDLPFTMDAHDATGGKALDRSGRGYDATFGATTAAPTKLSARGYYFDGSNDIMTVNGVPFRFGTGNFTIEALVNTVWTSATQGSIAWTYSSASTGERGFRLQINGAKTVSFYVDDAVVTSNEVLKVSKLYHLTAVRDGDTLRLYVGGTQDNSATGAAAKVATSTANLSIGQSSGSLHKGNIHSLRIFDFALTPTQVIERKNLAMLTLNQV